MSFITEVKDRLVAQGVGVFGTNIFIGSKATIPVGEGPYVSLTDTGGSGFSRTQNDTATEYATAQVLVRAKDYVVAEAKIAVAFAALGGVDGLYNLTIGSTAYVSLTARQRPTEIGLDDQKRVMFSFNILAEKYPS